MKPIQISFIFLFLFFVFGIVLNLLRYALTFDLIDPLLSDYPLTFLTTCKNISYVGALVSLICCLLAMKKHVDN